MVCEAMLLGLMTFAELSSRLYYLVLRRLEPPLCRIGACITFAHKTSLCVGARPENSAGAGLYFAALAQEGAGGL